MKLQSHETKCNFRESFILKTYSCTSGRKKILNCKNECDMLGKKGSSKICLKQKKKKKNEKKIGFSRGQQEKVI